MLEALTKHLQSFFKMEASGGLLLIASTGLAFVLMNSPWADTYQSFFQTTLALHWGGFVLSKPLVLWINEGLMAIFFFLLGLEIRQEVTVGVLTDRRQLALALMGALGGLMVPALIYLAFNHDIPQATVGWAIPCATDVAFALGIMSLIRPSVPQALKALLMAIAIIDDLAAIIILAVYYTGGVTLSYLMHAGWIVAAMWLLKRSKVSALLPYVLLTAVLWFCLLKSGLHATLAGVVLAWMLPEQGSLSIHARAHRCQPWVAFFIVPVFALANAGFDVSQISLLDVLNPIPLGIMLGLGVGKPLGVYGTVMAAVRCGWVQLADGMSSRGLLGLSALCGVGFTMSIFIGMEAFSTHGMVYMNWVRLGVLSGSIISGVLGYGLLR